VHGSGGSPILVDDALIFSCDGASHPFVATLNKKTARSSENGAHFGRKRRSFSFSTPLAIPQGAAR